MIKDLLAQRLQQGFTRASVSSCSKWAEKYRVMGHPYPGPWKFTHHPWLREMSDCEDHLIIGQKAAQMGFTEWALNKTFYYIDIHKLDVLYILPSKDDASDFSSARFNVALEESEHLRNIFDSTDNVRLKKSGGVVLYVRGSKSRSQLKSIPTPIIIMDEVDEMDQDNIALAGERQSGQVIQKQLRLSTPTTDGHGINAAYKKSTQEEYFFKCPGCKTLITLDFPDSIVITAEVPEDPRLKESYYICHRCKAKLPQELKSEFLKEKSRGGTGHFVPAFPSRNSTGFTVSQMYSSTIQPWQLAEAYLLGEYDPSYEQEFWNSKMGRTHTAKEAKLTEGQVKAVIRDYITGPTFNNHFITMGVDVGKVLHYVIKEWIPPKDYYPGLLWNMQYKPKTICIGKTTRGPNDFRELAEIVADYKPNATVIDSEPERRAAYAFACEHHGKVLLCDYMHTQQGKHVQEGAEEELILKVNRTSWLDLTLSRYKSGDIHLPNDTPDEFIRHLQEPTRVLKKDKWGNSFAIYTNKGPDHYAHADNYAEIALPFAGSIYRNIPITESYNV